MTLRTLSLHLQRSTLLALQSLARPTTLPPHLQVGLRGEFEALFYLRRLNYIVIARRWRTPDLNGDLDLIAYDGPTLCFIEVKTRATRDLYPAAHAIDDAKRTMLRRMASSFLRTLPQEDRDDTPRRFDVLSVYLAGSRPACELLRDAFPWREAVPARYGV